MSYGSPRWPTSSPSSPIRGTRRSIRIGMDTWIACQRRRSTSSKRRRGIGCVPTTSWTTATSARPTACRSARISIGSSSSTSSWSSGRSSASGRFTPRARKRCSFTATTGSARSPISRSSGRSDSTASSALASTAAKCAASPTCRVSWSRNSASTLTSSPSICSTVRLFKTAVIRWLTARNTGCGSGGPCCGNWSIASATAAISIWR